MRHHDDDDAADDLRRWLGDNTAPTDVDVDVDDPPRRWTRSQVVLGLLVLAPWVVLAALALTDGPATWPDGGPDPAADVMDAGTARPTDASSEQAAARARTTDAVATPTATAPPAVGPTAVRLVRDAVTRAGARSMALDAAAAEAADVLADDTWTVRVHAVVLRGDRRRWHTARHEVWVAPVGLRDGHVVGLDRPWRVATMDDGIAPLSWTPADIDHRAVRGALDDAAIAHGGALVVQQNPSLPSVVRVATTDGRRLWVRLDPEAVVVGHEVREDAP